MNRSARILSLPIAAAILIGCNRETAGPAPAPAKVVTPEPVAKLRTKSRFQLKKKTQSVIEAGPKVNLKSRDNL